MNSDLSQPMTYLEFLQTLKVVRMLFGLHAAQEFWTNNYRSYYNLGNLRSLNSERNKNNG